MPAAAAAPKKQVMHIQAVPPELVQHPSVFVCLPPNVFNGAVDYGVGVTTFFHPQTTNVGGNTYKCKICGYTFSSQ